MAFQRLELPTIQNWSCHNCSGCCRQHLIAVTEEERQRIIEQNWSEQDGIPAGRPLLVRMPGVPWKKRYRLGHQNDGACVFLNEQGLCRIHAKFGEAAKPLPCRIYPFAFHPAGRNAAISLRFSCPSVVENKGRALTDQMDELKKLAAAVVPAGVEKLPAPPITSREQVDWPDFHRFVDALDKTMATPETGVTVKLLRALFWMKVVDQSKFDTVRGQRLDEFLELMTQAAKIEISESEEEVQEPGRASRMQFRMLVAQYARKDTLLDLESGLASRWRLLTAAIKFAKGKGNIPALQNIFQEVPFADLETPFGRLSEEAEEILTRYFRVKIEGLHFCGRAYYDIPLVEGFQSLALIYPAILWLARWIAAGEGRNRLETSDVTTALTIADHQHAYSPAFGQGNFRRRVRQLARAGAIEKLCLWYSR